MTTFLPSNPSPVSSLNDLKTFSVGVITFSTPAFEFHRVYRTGKHRLIGQFVQVLYNLRFIRNGNIKPQKPHLAEALDNILNIIRLNLYRHICKVQSKAFAQRVMQLRRYTVLYRVAYYGNQSCLPVILSSISINPPRKPSIGIIILLIWTGFKHPWDRDGRLCETLSGEFNITTWKQKAAQFRKYAKLLCISELSPTFENLSLSFAVFTLSDVPCPAVLPQI